MPFHVVHADRRHSQRGGQGTPDRSANQQSTHQAGPRCVSYSVNLLSCAGCFLQAFIQQWQGLSNVVTGGDLRYHAAIFGMNVSLRIKRMGQQAQFTIVNGDTRFVTGRFNTQNTQNLNSVKSD